MDDDRLDRPDYFLACGYAGALWGRAPALSESFASPRFADPVLLIERNTELARDPLRRAVELERPLTVLTVLERPDFPQSSRPVLLAYRTALGSRVTFDRTDFGAELVPAE